MLKLRKLIPNAFILTFISAIFSSMGVRTLTIVLPLYFLIDFPGGDAAGKECFFSIYGNYMSLIYFSPFVGGVLADFVLGKNKTVLLGFVLSLLGASLLYHHYWGGVAILYPLLMISLGKGLIKPCLTSEIGNLCVPQTTVHKEKVYKIFYICLCLDYFLSAILSGYFYEVFSFHFILTLELVLMILAFIAYVSSNLQLQKPKLEMLASKPEKESVVIDSKSSVIFFCYMLMISYFFFIGYSQMSSSMIVYLHQKLYEANAIRSFVIPWFNGFAVLGMFLCIPFVEKSWVRKERKDLFRIHLGFFLTFFAFVLIYLTIFFDIRNTIFLLSSFVFASLLIVIADFCIKPVLFAGAHKYVPPKYRSLMTAIMFSSIGLGIKSGAVFASFGETIGLLNFFMIGAIAFLLIGSLSYFLEKNLIFVKVTAC